MGAAARREPHPRHGPDQARLGGVAPARLGVPITVFRHKESGRVIPGRDFNGSGELIDRITEAFRKEGADAWFEQGAKERFLQGLVDDPESGRRSRTFSMSGSIQARPTLSCLETRPDLRLARLALSRRLRPASRLVPILAARSLRHARPRAIRGGAHPWLRRGRGRAQDVEVHGQCGGAAGRDRANRRRDLRLWAMSSDYAEDLRIGQDIIKANVRILPQAEEHAPLPARQSRALPAEPRRRLSEMPELERYMLARASPNSM